MPEGFEYDPEAIRAFAEVFTRASSQVDQLRTALARPSAAAADFGDSWRHHGDEFAAHLGDVGGQLTRGTDLVVRADTTGLRNLRSAENGSGGAV